MIEADVNVLSNALGCVLNQGGTAHEELFSGLFAGFTQVDLAGSPTNNSMLFLQPAASKHQFIAGLSARRGRSARVVLTDQEQRRTDDGAGRRRVPSNGWLASPNGDQYLDTVGSSAQLRSELAALRQ